MFNLTHKLVKIAATLPVKIANFSKLVVSREEGMGDGDTHVEKGVDFTRRDGK